MLVTLRPLTIEDTGAVHDWARLPESCRYQAWGPDSYDETREYVRTTVARTDLRASAVLADGEVIGTAMLKFHGASTGEIAYAVHPRRWGQGIATLAARELVRRGFAEHGLHRVFGTCDPRNLASAAVLRKVGMRYEGRMRGTFYLRDGWRDSDLYAILADD